MKQKIIVSLIIAVVLVLSVTMLFLRPYINVGHSYELTGPTDERVWGLVNSGASVNAIQAEIASTGKNVNEFNWISGSLLSRAVELKRYDLVDWLLLSGADPNGAGHAPKPLWMAVSMTQDVRMVRLLIEEGADVDFGDEVTLLSIAKEEGNVEIIEILEDAIEKKKLLQVSDEINANK